MNGRWPLWVAEHRSLHTRTQMKLWGFARRAQREAWTPIPSATLLHSLNACFVTAEKRFQGPNSEKA
eukprot:1140877-Pelagomonas_calceolata.AAC.4